MNDRTKVVCIVGPTAVGKSQVAIDICKAFGGEVISADSMQIYKGMDIGTAKVSKEEQQGVAHHLLDVIEPSETFSVSKWQIRADKVIQTLHQSNRLPVVCGGTGLYVRSITDDLAFAEQPEVRPIREKWQKFAEDKGAAALYDELKHIDVRSAERLHPNDVKRVIRALEVAETGDRQLSSAYDWTPKSGRYDTLMVGLWMDRQALYDQVNQRVDKMVADGLFEEVERLLADGLNLSHTSMQAIGYKEIVACLAGQFSREDAVAQVKQNSRRYVKRQLSWFRREPRIHWFEAKPRTGLSLEEHNRLWKMITEFLEGKFDFTRE